VGVVSADVTAIIAAAITVAVYLVLSANLMRLFDKWESSWDRPPRSPYELKRQELVDNLNAAMVAVGIAFVDALTPALQAASVALAGLVQSLWEAFNPVVPGGPVVREAVAPSPDPVATNGDVRDRRDEAIGGED
jgi:hypothetical protein